MAAIMETKLIAIIDALDNGAKPRSFATTINVVKIYIQLVFPLIILYIYCQIITVLIKIIINNNQ